MEIEEKVKDLKQGKEERKEKNNKKIRKEKTKQLKYHGQ